LCSPEEADLDLLAEELGLHALAVEDALKLHQRPKLDRYSDHLFLSAYSITFSPETASVETSEIAAFITERAFVTVHKDPDFDV
ncbi:CorA family divalent cation transporter, partial [Mucilaginibacter sp. 5C4]